MERRDHSWKCGVEGQVGVMCRECVTVCESDSVISHLVVLFCESMSGKVTYEEENQCQR